MTFQQMECFLSVANHLNFSQAADDLYMSQSSVTQQIKSLEAELGFMLLDRDKRGTRLTKSGEYLKVEFEKSIESMRLSVGKARLIASGAKSAIKIAYPNPPQWGRINKLLFSFKMENPDVAISLKLGKGRELSALFGSGGFDVMFGDMEYLMQHKTCEIMPLFRVKTYVLIPEGHELCGNRLVSVEDVNRFGAYFVNMDGVDPTISTLSGRLKKAGINLNRLVPVSHREDVVASVYAGIGLGIIPGSMGEDFYTAEVATLDTELSYFDFGCVWRVGENDAAIAAFIAKAREFEWVGEKLV